MKIKDIINDLESKKTFGELDKEINNIQYDSRKVTSGSMFVALTGYSQDGHKYIEKAIEQGATCVVLEKQEFVIEKSSCIFVIVENSRKALSQMVHKFFGEPTKNFDITAITGTNGKTTITYLLYALNNAVRKKSAIIGTTGILIGDEFFPATHTTPESLELAGIFQKMKLQEVDYVAMEASSHALHQHRVDNISFSSAILTNLTQEHLDYHKTLQEYADAKKILFDSLSPDSIAIAMLNDDYCKYILKDTLAKQKYFIGYQASSDIVIEDIELRLDCSTFKLVFTDKMPQHLQGEYKFKIRLLGKFNIENAAIAVALMFIKGYEYKVLASALETAEGAPGRMSKLMLSNGAVALVDYAHTPDALEKAIRACRDVLESSGNHNAKLIVVFGCGGDRDKGKRPVMGKLSSELADYSIITSDNPRTEDPDKIIEQIYVGIANGFKKKVVSITHRSEAIQYAARLSNVNDIILIAGKGHETYQIIGEVKHHFDDKEELSKFTNNF